MGSGRAERPSSNSKGKSKRNPLNSNDNINIKKKKKKKNKVQTKTKIHQINNNNNSDLQLVSPTQQLSFFLDQFQSANNIRLSSLELDSIKETCVVEPSQDLSEDVETLGKHIKKGFGESWKQTLSESQLVNGQIEPGSPSLLIITTSASRALQLLRGLRSLTKECHAVKLFSKHMKVEEQIVKGTSNADYLYLQVSLLKNRVNIASGTPSRIKKLIDIEALGLSRLAMIVLDIHTDVKGYSLFTLPQVRDEFWDLYKSCFHQRLMQGDLRICLYGPIPNVNEFKGKRKETS